MRKKFLFQDIARVLSSPRLTTVGLFLLILLTVWGTLYQVDHGLYAAQQKFFHSWVIWIFGYMPLPGSRLVMTALLVNLFFAIFFRLGLHWRRLGNLLAHIGIVLLLLGSFIIQLSSLTARMVIGEKETTGHAVVPGEWELAVWKQATLTHPVQTLPTDEWKEGDSYAIPDTGLAITVTAYYPNCRSSTGGSPESAAGRSLIPLPSTREKGKNVAGARLTIRGPSGSVPGILLYGLDPDPRRIVIDSRAFYFQLRLRHHLLPFRLELIDFKMIVHPNSVIPKSYQSRVLLKKTGGLQREVLISMNKPLRHAGVTLYQSSYFTSDDGLEHTVLTLVRSPARLLPYLSCLMIFVGISLHFLSQLIPPGKKGSKK